MASFLFVHSPLVGPSSLRRLADLAIADGVAVALPDLTPMAGAARPDEDYLHRAVDAGTRLMSPIAVVGHSGAGPFLPNVGRALGSKTFLVFVDAVVPPASGTHCTSASMLEMLDEQTDNELLRAWLDWWPADVMKELLPDPADRAELAADMPRIPRAFYDSEVALPPGWSEHSCGYVQLSEAYANDHDQAAAWGWPTAKLVSNHLATHTAPVEVLSAIRRVLDELT